MMRELKQWIAVQTQVNAEEKARINLEQQGYDCFLPRYKKKISHARKISVVLRALFPRYIFVRLDFEKDQWRKIRSTVGVSSIIMSGEKPAPIFGNIIEGMIERSDNFGLIILKPASHFKDGETVRIANGAFEEMLGLIEGISDKDRVTLLVKMLGRTTRINIAISEVEKIGCVYD